MIRRPPRSPLFPYPPLSRSGQLRRSARRRRARGRAHAEGIRPPRSRLAGDRSQARVTSEAGTDRKSTRLNSSHSQISYAVFCLKKKKKKQTQRTSNTTRRGV